MKKFFKSLRKFIKILLLTLLSIILFLITIILIFNNRNFKYYDGYKISFNNSKEIKNGYEIYYNLKTSNFTFNQFKNGDIYLSSDFDMYYNNEEYLILKTLTYNLFSDINNKKNFYISGKINTYYKNKIIEGETIVYGERNKETKNAILVNTGYYENGNLKAKLYMTGFDENGKYTTIGNLHWFYENGNLNTIQNTRDGLLDGEFFEYYENGELKEEGIYESGKKIGIWTGYHENGEIESVCNYNYGLEECYDTDYLNEIISGKQEKDINENIEIYHINVLYPLPESIIKDKLDVVGYIKELPNSKALIYIDNNLVTSTIVDAEGTIYQSVENINSGEHSLKIIIQDIDGYILGSSDEINFLS